MTEEQIERAVERKFDRLDAELMAGKITEAEYDNHSGAIMEWAHMQYRAAIRKSEGW